MTALLGGLAPAAFLRRHWQRRPLLVRQAVPGFAGILDRDALLALARRDDAVSRLVIEHRGRRASRWERHDGPFASLDARVLPERRWTVLVHGVESLVPGGWQILRAFDFLPAARVDDLMVSYAADGGSVGPHVDRYDAFLLQGPGRRLWQISTRGDRRLDPDAGIEVLASFTPEAEWVLEPGDMLYVPPGVAHWGVADGPCFTYSIGFLAPSETALAQSFLGWLANTLPFDDGALYADPGLVPARAPLAVPDALVRHTERVLRRIRWDRRTVEDFVGCFLTRPKPQVHFAAPRRPLSRAAFRRRRRLALALPSRGLVRGDRVYLNGQAVRAGRAFVRRFAELVRERETTRPLDDELWYEWYLAGWLKPV